MMTTRTFTRLNTPQNPYDIRVTSVVDGPKSHGLDTRRFYLEAVPRNGGKSIPIFFDLTEETVSNFLEFIYWMYDNHQRQCYCQEASELECCDTEEEALVRFFEQQGNDVNLWEIAAPAPPSRKALVVQFPCGWGLEFRSPKVFGLSQLICNHCVGDEFDRFLEDRCDTGPRDLEYYDNGFLKRVE